MSADVLIVDDDARCTLCDELFDVGMFAVAVGTLTPLGPRTALAHRECVARLVIGGIGHLRDCAFWCGVMRDPDGGHSVRESALLVVEWVAEHGLPKS